MDRIEQLIGDMENYLEECKSPAFSGSHKAIIDRNRINDFLTELTLCLPDTIKQSQKIVDNRNAIIDDANTEKAAILSQARIQAEQILADATARTSKLTDEHEIVQQAIAQGTEIVSQAQQQAQDILNQAIRESNAFKESALAYTNDAMTHLQQLYEENLALTRKLFSDHLDAVNERYQTISTDCETFRASNQTFSLGTQITDEPSDAD